MSYATRAKVIRLIMTSRTEHSCLVDTFYHIRQVAARVAKFVLVMHLGLYILGREGRRGSAMVPFERGMVVSCIGSPL